MVKVPLKSISSSVDSAAYPKSLARRRELPPSPVCRLRVWWASDLRHLWESMEKDMSAARALNNRPVTCVISKHSLLVILSRGPLSSSRQSYRLYAWLYIWRGRLRVVCCLKQRHGEWSPTSKRLRPVYIISDLEIEPSLRQQNHEQLGLHFCAPKKGREKAKRLT